MDKANVESIADRYLDSLYYIAINYIGKICIFASSASIIIEAACLLEGDAPNPPGTSFHSGLRINKVDAENQFA